MRVRYRLGYRPAAAVALVARPRNPCTVTSPLPVPPFTHPHNIPPREPARPSSRSGRASLRQALVPVMQAVHGCATCNCAFRKQCTRNSYYELYSSSSSSSFPYTDILQIPYILAITTLYPAQRMHTACYTFAQLIRLTAGTVIAYLPLSCPSPLRTGTAAGDTACSPLQQSPVRYESVRAFLGVRAGCGCDLVADGALPSR